jgi:hypothetical protein
MKLGLIAVLAIVVVVFSAGLPPTAEAQTKVAPKATGKAFEAPGSAMAPKGTVQGRMVSGGLSATCTSTDGTATCTCPICWATTNLCGCTTLPVTQELMKSGTIKFREQRAK